MNNTALVKLALVFNFVEPLIAVRRNFGLLAQLVQRNVQQRYRGSMLGIVWSFCQPLLMLCVYTFVFGTVFKARWGVDVDQAKGAFSIIMFCGIMMHSLMFEALNSSCMCIVGNQNLVKKVIFPLEILPLAQVLSVYVNGLAWIFLLFLGVVFVVGHASWTMLLLPVVFVPYVIFTLGFGYLVAALGVFVKDTAYVLGIVMQVLLFGTPIFYPLSAVPKDFQWILFWNPLTVFIEQARAVFVYGTMPNWHFLGIASLASLVVFQLGYYFFARTKRGFADVL